MEEIIKGTDMNFRNTAIEQAYIGDAGKCMCGCSGIFYLMEEDPAKVRKVIKVLKNAKLICHDIETDNNIDIYSYDDDNGKYYVLYVRHEDFTKLASQAVKPVAQSIDIPKAPAIKSIICNDDEIIVETEPMYAKEPLSSVISKFHMKLIMEQDRFDFSITHVKAIMFWQHHDGSIRSINNPGRKVWSIKTGE